MFRNDSNPTRRKYRDAANAARKVEIMPMIPVDELQPVTSGDYILDELNMENMSLAGNGQSQKIISSASSMVSEGGLSQVSRFTTFTSCTNPTFDVVHRLWKSGSSLQKEVLAVLSAIAEVIKDENGSESDVEYFAILLTTLESTDSEEVARAAATAYLLHLIVKKVPKEVLQQQFSRSIKILTDAMMAYTDSEDSGAALKFLLATVSTILRAQPPMVWKDPDNRAMLVFTASLCNHEKPRVRTMSRKVMRMVLTDPINSLENGLHPAAGVVGEYIDERISDALEEKNSAMEATRYLCLLEGIMHKMPAHLFQRLTEDILKGLTLSDPQIKCAALQCLYRALQRQPTDTVLSAETTRKLIISLRELAPLPSEVAVCACWAQALVEAHVCLSLKSKNMSLMVITESMQLITPLFQIANDELSRVIVQVLSRLIEQCIQEEEKPARHLLQLLESSLTGFSAIVWKQIFKTMTFLFQTSGPALCSDELVKVLRSMARLREEESCFCKQEIEFALGAAVRYVGVQHVLNVLSLQIDPDAPVLPTDFRRSWLLPIFRVNIRNAPLSLFIKYFLPLAMKLNRRIPTLDKVVARAYSIVQSQLWDLLPPFLASSSDFEESFPQLAPILGTALTERLDLRLTLLAGLRAALGFASAPSAPIERRETISRFAKNYLPILFNIYTNDGKVDSGYDYHGVRLSTLATIGLFVEIADKVLLSNYIDSAINRFTNTELKEDQPKEEVFRNKNLRDRIADILIVFMKNAVSADIQKIFSAIHVYFGQPNDFSMQKKAYRILEELLKRRSEPEIGLIFENDKSSFYELVLKPYDEIAAPARAAYQKSLLYTMDSIDSYSQLKEFSLRALDTTIQCLEKANSMPCRENASNSFQTMCNRLIERGSEENEHPSAALYPVFQRIYEMNTQTAEGKEVNLETSRACLVALNILAQKHMKVLNASHISRLIAQGCSTLSETRPTARILGIRLLRVLANKMPNFALHQYRDLILQAFFEQDTGETTTSQIRKANRLLLEVFVEKFGQGVVEKYTNKPEWQKQMRNIVKSNRRKARLAAGIVDEKSADDPDNVSQTGSNTSARTAGADTILNLLEDSDDDDDREEQEEKRSRVGSIWLKEDADGDVFDLLDRNMLMNKVSTINPSLIAKREARLSERKKDNYGFAVTKSGKLIIDDEETDEKAPKRKKKDPADDMADLFEDKKSDKKTKENQDDYDEDDDKDDGKTKVSSVSRATFKSNKSISSRYKPGGTGIHRDLNRPIAKPPKNQKKAGGDLIKKNQTVQPYAYVPLKQMKKKGQSSGSQANEEIRRVIGKRKRKQ